MADESILRDLFDLWERARHGGQFNLVPDATRENYTRLDEATDRPVPREAYAAEPI